MTTSHRPTTLSDWLDDLTVRFLLNLPASELSSVPRLCFQVEEAQWFYEDFIRPAVAASGHTPLPSLALRQFCLLLFQHCPLLSGFTDAQHIAAYEEFLAYKVRVPVRGVIMLDEQMENVVLVRGWKKGASWSFPRGKINKDEKDLDCAVREVYEETGYDARQAGLVPENEGDAKFIDITMREQHMRLFVLRGVPKDTHFEPRTRKEIGGIKWYAIKDLPGFKKQKAHHEGDTTGTSKFYMVAPFLAQLKKWIGQQKKQSTAKTSNFAPVNGNVAQVAAAEDVELDDESAPEMAAVFDSKIDDPKKLLAKPTQPEQPAASKPPQTPANDLLAMLRGTAPASSLHQVPRTPFEHVNLFPEKPETPQPDHTRHQPLNYRQNEPPLPQYPLSPHHKHQQDQRPLPTPNIFLPGPNGMPRKQFGSPGAMPSHMQHVEFMQRHGAPNNHQGISFGPRNLFPPNDNHQRDVQRGPLKPHLQPQHQQMPFGQRHPTDFQTQDSHDVTARGPAVPSASQLPPPRLNAQSMKLLDAFKNSPQGPRMGAPTASTSAAVSQRPTSKHQAALLGLLKNAPAKLTPDPQPEASQSVSPTMSNTTDTTIKQTERRPTLNEITRTLPAKLKTKSPPVTSPLSPPASPPARNVPGREQPDPRQLFDPSASINLASQPLPPSTLQPVAARRASKSPGARDVSPAGSPSRRNGAHNTRMSQPVPVYTILARPESAKGPKSPTAPTTPLRNEEQQVGFHPQVVKRSNGKESLESAQQPVDNKDQLLALFGKSPASATSTPTPPPQTTPTGPLNPSHRPNVNMVDLFNYFNTSSPRPSQPPSVPPPAPRIEPDRQPSSKLAPTTTAQPPPKQQNLLLELFNHKANPPVTPITSPGTPVSPFTLGTPATEMRPAQLPAKADGPTSRLASVCSPGGSGGGTPTEAKEFLMDFLNGVVRNEGHWDGGP